MKAIFKITPASPRIDTAILVARVGIATLMLIHGLPKLGMFSQSPVQFMDFMGIGAELTLALAIGAEVGCSILILIGLGTRVASVPLILTMLVAIFIAHGADPFAIKEKAILFLLIYVVLLITGSGRYSVDSLISKRI